MDKPVKTRESQRPPSDFVGAVCFVLLVVTVVYASLTAA